MMKFAKTVVTLVFLLATIGAAASVCADLIPTPDFSDHPIPTQSAPRADAFWWAWGDIAALFIALCLATYLAHVDRSRKKLLLLTIASLIWFGFVRQGCVCAIGATQNVAFALWNPSYAIPIAAVVFFSLPIVFTLFFGRTFCAAVCPLGAIQELVVVRHVRLPYWLNQSLGLLPYFYLGAAVLLASTGAAFIICRFDPFVGFFRLSGDQSMLLFGGGLLLLGAFVGRPYCRFLCPYGAILRVLSPLSKWHVGITPSECVQCRLCEDTCPYDAITTPTIAQSADDRRRGKHRLFGTLVLAPVLIAGGAWFGNQLGAPLAAWDSDVRLAEQLSAEELGLTQQVTKASDAFRGAGKTPALAYQRALELRSRYRSLGVWLGAWVGLVVSAKLILLSLRRLRKDYEPNRAGCVSCGRCYAYCPVEQVRCGWISDVSEHPEVKT